MKRLFWFIVLLPGFLFCQVGINTVSPSPASVLHVEALNPGGTYGGFMPPRVTLAQRNLIPVSSIDDGLMVYLIDGTTRCIQVYETSTSTWRDFYCMPVATVTYSQNFETVPVTPTLTFTGGSGSTATGVGAFPASPKFSEGTQGYQVNNVNSVLSFDAIDSSAHSIINLTFDLASFSITSGNGTDDSDKIEILISTDNITWFSGLIVNGFNNARWDFTGTSLASSIYNGNNSPASYQPVSGGDLTGVEAFSKISLTGLPSVPTLYIQIRMDNDSTNEIWVIDNVILSLM